MVPLRPSTTRGGVLLLLALAVSAVGSPLRRGSFGGRSRAGIEARIRGLGEIDVTTKSDDAEAALEAPDATESTERAAADVVEKAEEEAEKKGEEEATSAANADKEGGEKEKVVRGPKEDGKAKQGGDDKMDGGRGKAANEPPPDKEMDNMKIMDLVKQKELLIAKKGVKEQNERLKKKTEKLKPVQKEADATMKKVSEAKEAYRTAKDKAEMNKDKLAKLVQDAKQVKAKLDVTSNSKQKLELTENLVKLRNASAQEVIKVKDAVKAMQNASQKLDEVNQAGEQVEERLKTAKGDYALVYQESRDAKEKQRLLGKTVLDDAFCPPGSTRSANFGNKCMYSAFCPPGATRTENGKGCTIDITCPPGSTRNGTVSKGQTCHADSVELRCPKGTAKEHPDSTVCHFPSACPNGTTLNGTRCLRPKPKVKCPRQAKLLGENLCVLPAKCPDGSDYIGGVCTPRKITKAVCPEGSIEQEGKCFIIRRICPKNSKDVAGICYSTDVKCPPGTKLEMDRCISKRVECPAGTQRTINKDTGEEQCLVSRCPKGSRQVGSECVGTVVCPRGTVPAPDGAGWCLKPAVCPDNSVRKGDTCVPEMACENPMATIVNGKCILPAVCPDNTVELRGRCVRQEETVNMEAKDQSPPKPGSNPIVDQVNVPSSQFSKQTTATIKAAEAGAKAAAPLAPEPAEPVDPQEAAKDEVSARDSEVEKQANAEESDPGSESPGSVIDSSITGINSAHNDEQDKAAESESKQAVEIAAMDAAAEQAAPPDSGEKSLRELGDVHSLSDYYSFSIGSGK